MEFDLLIVGASFAGLAAARTAASRGLRVAVIEAKREPGARVHTSGILVKEVLQEIDIPHRFTRRVPGVRLYAPNLNHIDLFSPGYAFFTTATAELLRWMAQEARDAGAHILCGLRFEAADRQGELIRLKGVDLAARYLIGADGARSLVAKQFGLDANRRFLTGVEVEFEASEKVDPFFLHCFVDSKIAPGYIAWIAPGPERLQVGLATKHGAKPDLAAFLAHTEGLFRWKSLRIVERRSGLIPCGGPLRRIAAPGVLLVGDAAGWVSPMTGGGIRLALRHGRQAAALVSDYLQSRGPTPDVAISRDLPRFHAKRLLRRALDLAPPNTLVNLALATRPARAIAEQIYFHRRGGLKEDRDTYRHWMEKELARARPDKQTTAEES